MCGINGIVKMEGGSSRKAKALAQMNKALRHRGPDEEGIISTKDGKAAFGAVRLDIVDAVGGHQPMVLESEGGKEIIGVFNGEIYNHNEIRKVLEGKGHRFKSGCDTEVAIRSYLEWGAECLDRFRGIYAIAVYDGDGLFLARDRLGVKPLYCHQMDDDSIVFSSEPKGILACPGVTREPDRESILEYFIGSFVFTNSSAPLDRSFFRGISSLGPGGYRTDGEWSGEEHWRLRDAFGHRKDKGPGHIRRELMRAILEQIPQDVGFGTLLSGGLDSSIVSAIIRANTDQDFVSTTLSYPGNSTDPDLEHARLLAREKGIVLHETRLTAKGLMALIDPLIRAMDEPHDTIRQLGLYAAYRTLRGLGCKVALVGEGSDEFNLGYWHNSPGLGVDLCKGRTEFRDVWKRRAIHASGYFTKEFLKNEDADAIIERIIDRYFDLHSDRSDLDSIQYYYGERFLKYRLDANDRCAMANSIEARVPFCDHRFVETALRVPPHVNLRGGSEKMALRDAFRNDLPPEIVSRRKYALPECVDLEFYRMLSEELDRNIHEADKGVWEMLDKQYIEGLNSRFKEKIACACRSPDRHVDFTGEIRMKEEVDLRVKHVFLALTFLRWYDMYFVTR